MASVNLMGTSCTGICLEHQLSIFWLTRRGVLVMIRDNYIDDFRLWSHTYGDDWSKLVTIGDDWSQLVKIGVIGDNW